MITVENADIYFTAHLAYELWSQLDQTAKNNAITMAQYDIAAALSGLVDANNEYHTVAVYEQALWLAQHFSELNRCQRVVSENIDGMGGVTYSMQDNALAPRVKLLLKLETAAPFRLGRG